jgi:predicted acetyltransferase
LTCDDHNIGSYRIMEANGAILEGKTVPEAYGHLIRRYWITL